MLRFGLREVLAAAVGAFAIGCGDPDPFDTGGGGFGGGTGVVSVFVSTGVGQVTTGTGLSNVAFKSGTRLRAHVIDGGVDARSFDGWYDAALGMDCTSTVVAGQPNRCLPPQVEGVVYVDSGCTNAAATFASAPPPYVVEPHAGAQTCDSYRAWQVGPESIAATIYALGTDGVCAEVGVDATVRALTPVPLDTFAELDVSDEHLAGLDWRRVENGPDGAFRAVSALEGPNGSPCEVFVNRPDGNRVCMPTQRVRRSPVFADGACGEPAIALGKCEITQTYRIVDLNFDPCEFEAAKLYTAGDVVTDVFEGEECVSTGQRGRRLGKLIQPLFSTYVYWETRSGAEVLMALDIASGVPVRADGTFYRSAADLTGCTVVRTADGTRCIPKFATHAHTFADSACTDPVVVALGQSCGLGPDVAGQLGDDGSIEALRPIGRAFSGAIWSDASGTCAQISPGGPNWRAVQDVDLPLDAYPELDEYVE